MRVGIFTIALLVASSGFAAAECVESRLIQLPLGCIKLPCAYRAITGRAAIDVVGGSFVTTDGKERIQWFFGGDTWWPELPGAEGVLWRRAGFKDWHLNWRAMFEFSGERYVLVTNRELWLMAPASSPDALERLEALAMNYDRAAETVKCEPTEEPAP